MNDDLADALGRVVAEAEPDAERLRWAVDQLLAGRDLAGVESDLTGEGLSRVEAEATVEEARVRTRRARGVVTRDDVVGSLEGRYRRSTTGMAAFYRSGGGPLGIIAFATGLRQALAAARHLTRLARRDGPNLPPSFNAESGRDQGHR